MRRRAPQPLAISAVMSLVLIACALRQLQAQLPAPPVNPVAQTTPGAPPDPRQQQLADLAAAHQAALDSGDPARVLATGRDLGAFALRLLGDLTLAQRQAASAIESYQRSLEVQDSPDTHLDLALALLFSGKPDQAGVEATKVSAADSSNPRAWRVRGQIHLEQGNVSAAADALRHAWQLAPDLDTGMLLLGADLRSNQTGDATRVTERMIQSAGESPRIHLLIANVHHSADDLPGTIAELTRAIALDPQLAAAHVALGDAFLELNEFQYNAGSLREFTEAQRLDSSGYLANFDLGSTLSKYERYAEAAPFLKQAATADPLAPDPWLQLGMNAYAEDHGAEATAALENAAALTGADQARNNYQLRRVYAVLSRLETEAGDTRQANAFADQAEKLHAEMLRTGFSSSLSESTGLIVSDSPDRASARSAATTAPVASAGPSPAERALGQQLLAIVANSLNDAGTALARTHDYAGALPLFRQASLADSSLSPVLRNLGLAAFHTGHYDEAVTALTRALEQQPGDALARSYLEQARALRSGAPPTH